jgi:hypothetical protein
MRGKNNEQPARFVIPYSYEKKLYDAYNDEFQSKDLKDSDWLAIVDGDMMFFIGNFGHQINDYIKKYPEAGMFTCYANQSAFNQQKRKGVDSKNPDIKYHAAISKQMYATKHTLVKPVTGRIEGFLLVINVGVWRRLWPEIKNTCEVRGAKILAVDTSIMQVMVKHKLPVYVMRGMYVFHYRRLLDGKNPYIK